MNLRRSLLASMVLCSSLGLAAPASAQPQTSLSGVIFAEYTAPTDGRASAFDVTRSFLTAKARLNDVWSGTIMYNAAPLLFISGVTNGVGTTRTEAHDALLQTAYVQAAGLLPGLNLQLGMVSSPWFDFEVGYWGYRMLGIQYFPIFNTGYVPSYDLGLKAVGKVGPVGYMAQVDNGAGFRSPENNGTKAYTAGLTVEPLAGLTLAALGYRGSNPSLAQADRYSAFAGYRTDAFRVAAQATRMVNQAVGGSPITGQVLSAYTVVGLPVPALPSPELIARVDLLDHNMFAAPVVGQGETLQGVVGLSIKPTPGVTLVLDDQVAQETLGGVTTTRNTVALHTQLTF
jgi:hypothetical protein